MIGVLQFLYFCVSILWKDVNMYFWQLVGLKNSNGFNVKWLNEERGSLPKILKDDMGYHMYFINNMNVMLLILICYVSLLFIVYRISSVYNKCKKDKKISNADMINQTNQDLQLSSRPPSAPLQKNKYCPPNALKI